MHPLDLIALAQRRILCLNIWVAVVHSEHLHLFRLALKTRKINIQPDIPISRHYTFTRTVSTYSGVKSEAKKSALHSNEQLCYYHDKRDENCSWHFTLHAALLLLLSRHNCVIIKSTTAHTFLFSLFLSPSMAYRFIY